MQLCQSMNNSIEDRRSLPRTRSGAIGGVDLIVERAWQAARYEALRCSSKGSNLRLVLLPAVSEIERRSRADFRAFTSRERQGK